MRDFVKKSFIINIKHRIFVINDELSLYFKRIKSVFIQIIQKTAKLYYQYILEKYLLLVYNKSSDIMEML